MKPSHLKSKRSHAFLQDMPQRKVNEGKTHESKAHKLERQSGKAQNGFTIIELLIAMALGLTLIASAVTIFSGSRKSVELNSALTDMQDSARFALDAITRDVRMAGFQGCVDINTSTAKILADSAPTDDYFASAVSASVVGAAGVWEPVAPLGFTVPVGRGAPVPGTHALSVQFGSAETYTFDPLPAIDSDITLQVADAGLVEGDLALISNCQVADIFEVTSFSGTTVQHSASANRDKRLSAPYGQAGPNNRPRIMRFEANIYYIGDTQRTNGAGDKIYSLYKQTLPYTDQNRPIEMIEGVANLQVKLGFRDPVDASDRGLSFVKPDDAETTDGRVEVVQVGMLMQSYDSILQADDTSTYYIAGTALTPDDEPVDSSVAYASDKRMKLAFNTTVKIRNRR